MIDDVGDRRRRVGRIAAAMIGLLAFTGASAMPGLADSDMRGNAGKAKPVIAAICTKCHVVPGFPDDRVQPAAKAPSFYEIAENPGRYDDAQLTRFLARPHWPMQGIILSRRDIANILAFIHELRQQLTEKPDAGGK